VISCTVTIRNGNGEPLRGATVRVASNSGSTDRSGQWTTSVDPDIAASAEFVHPYYVPEKSAFIGPVQHSAWDNSLVQRQASPSNVSLTVTLGRLDTVPTLELPESRVEEIANAPPSDPAAALLFRPPRFSNRVRAYRFQWNDARTVHVAQPDLLPDPPYSGLPKGWARFHNEIVNADLAALGRFYWTEYPLRPSSPKWAVAIWSPNLSADTALELLDFVVFFSPHTQSYVAKYPYGLVRDTKPPDQQYMTLGRKYLVDEYFFVQQLLARRNRSVMVMPICNHGEWGPVASGEGLFRLLREVSVFLHRQCRTSNLGVMKPTDHPDSLAGLNQRTVSVPLTSSSFGSVPKVGKVVIGGFSTGIAAVKQVMTGWPVSLAQTFWGVTPGGGGSPEQQWAAAWRELWDLDGYHPQTGGWPAYLDQAAQWYGADSRRILRLYHSSGRVPPDPAADPHKLYKTLIGSGVRLDKSVPSTPDVGWARIVQGDRWTVVRMANEYVDHGPAAEAPPFDDAHHTTPKIGFSHAAGLTAVGK
jgi:hypothetical protein